MPQYKKKGALFSVFSDEPATSSSSSSSALGIKKQKLGPSTTGKNENVGLGLGIGLGNGKVGVRGDVPSASKGEKKPLVGLGLGLLSTSSNLQKEKENSIYEKPTLRKSKPNTTTTTPILPQQPILTKSSKGKNYIYTSPPSTKDASKPNTKPTSTTLIGRVLDKENIPPPPDSDNTTYYPGGITYTRPRPSIGRVYSSSSSVGTVRNDPGLVGLGLGVTEVEAMDVDTQSSLQGLGLGPMAGLTISLNSPDFDVDLPTASSSTTGLFPTPNPNGMEVDIDINQEQSLDPSLAPTFPSCPSPTRIMHSKHSLAPAFPIHVFPGPSKPQPTRRSSEGLLGLGISGIDLSPPRRNSTTTSSARPTPTRSVSGSLPVLNLTLPPLPSSAKPPKTRPISGSGEWAEGGRWVARLPGSESKITSGQGRSGQWIGGDEPLVDVSGIYGAERGLEPSGFREQPVVRTLDFEEAMRLGAERQAARRERERQSGGVGLGLGL